MSYQTASDRVQALRNIRGGRLTKWKGIAASMAPTVGAVVIFIGMSSTMAEAACTPSNIGTAGADVVTCDDTNDPAGAAVSLLAGDDVLVLTGTTMTAGNISLADGNDRVTMSGGTVNIVNLLNDNDTFTMTNGLVNLDVNGGDGDDKFDVSGSTTVLTRFLNAGADNDTINITDGATVGYVFGSSGSNTINITDSTITGGVSLSTSTGSALDLDGGVLIFSGTTAVQGTGTGAVTGSNANDTIRLQDSATIAGYIQARAGDDTVELFGGLVGGVVGNAGNDTFILDGATVRVGIQANEDDDTFIPHFPSKALISLS